VSRSTNKRGQNQLSAPLIDQFNFCNYATITGWVHKVRVSKLIMCFGEGNRSYATDGIYARVIKRAFVFYAA